MHSLFALATLAAVASAAVTAGAPTSSACIDNETAELHCYNGADDTAQNVTLADVTYTAKYLRLYGRQTREGRLFTMTAQDAPDCNEWTVYARKSALTVARHIDSTKNSSILFEDIANTIDGGEKATDDDKKKAIVGCLASGGSLGVKANLQNPVYNSDKYKAGGFSPEGIMIKVVSNAQ
ncbi:hypothetical protein QQS21_005867 [Conoideocrella luteorostrata]|uniref:Uncharacterized protein n=1 Tax=Conoideocrella luteorostrata TaxID=1105319 RepID=A0AAJ0CNP3_9HYPO|nr:hypothetical protein QQS21_005867 [Conoideocrella luteorostrata]